MSVITGEIQTKIGVDISEINPKIHVIALKTQISELSNFTNHKPHQNYDHDF